MQLRLWMVSVGMPKESMPDILSRLKSGLALFDISEALPLLKQMMLSSSKLDIVDLHSKKGFIGASYIFLNAIAFTNLSICFVPFRNDLWTRSGLELLDSNKLLLLAIKT